MKKTYLVLTVLLISLVSGLLLAGCGSEQTEPVAEVKAPDPVVIKIAHLQDLGHPIHRWTEDFKAFAEELSKGAIKVDIYPAAQLYPDDGSNIEATMNGVIGMSLPTTGALEKYDPRFQVFGIPGILPTYETLYKFEESPMCQELFKSADCKMKLNM